MYSFVCLFVSIISMHYVSYGIYFQISFSIYKHFWTFLCWLLHISEFYLFAKDGSTIFIISLLRVECRTKAPPKKAPARKSPSGQKPQRIKAPRDKKKLTFSSCFNELPTLFVRLPQSTLFFTFIPLCSQEKNNFQIWKFLLWKFRTFIKL